LISLAQRSLGDYSNSQATWTRSLDLAAEQPQNLALLAKVTSIWGWPKEQAETLQEAIDKYPDQKWATDQLTGLLYSQGDTKGLVHLMTSLQKASPEDPRLKNNLADVLLLIRSELPKAYRLASEAYESSTNNPFYISTYAYSLLLQDKPEMALKVIGGLKAEYLKVPSIAAYYGVIQAQTGHKELAREPLTSAAHAKQLLPEEKALVAHAMTQI
jgi:Flp pilus assembly protein TadD